MKAPVLDLESMLCIPCVDTDHDFALSPDGRQVVFSSNLNGRWALYSISLDGSGSPRLVGEGEGSRFAPRWSPDGRWLYGAVDVDGSECFDLFRFDPQNGEIANFTPDTSDSILAEFDLSPRGDSLCFISDRSGDFQAYQLDLQSGDVHRLGEFSAPVSACRYSPDGAWIAITMAAKGDDSHTCLIPLAGGDSLFIGGRDGPLNAHSIAWSPDSRLVAFTSDEKGFYNIGLFDLQSRRYAWVTSGKGEKTQPAWSPDGRRLAYVYGQGGRNSLALMDLILRETAICRHEAGIYHRPQFTPDSRSLVFLFESPRYPPDLYTLSVPDGIPQPLNRFVPAEIYGNYFVLPDEIEYASLDGEKIPALIYKPPQPCEPGVALVWIHGGPNWYSGFNWDPLLQHLVSRGWFVIAPNYRGSSGYGREWLVKNRFDLGGGETRDLAAACDTLIQNYPIDPERVAVAGRSHGGYLTMCCLTQYPDRWAAGSAVVPFLNWFTAHPNSRRDLQYWDLENFGDPVADKVKYHERSPFFFLEHILAPVQLICAENDPRCPAEESIAAHEQLTKLGKTCDLFLIPGEGHEFKNLENTIQAQHRQVDFLRGILEGI